MTGIIIIGFLLFLLLLALQGDAPVAPTVPSVVVIPALSPAGNRVGFDTILLIVFLIIVALVAVASH